MGAITANKIYTVTACTYNEIDQTWQILLDATFPMIFSALNPTFQGFSLQSKISFNVSIPAGGSNVDVVVSIDNTVRISNVAVPINNNDAVNKEYVDNAVANASGNVDINSKQDKFADVDNTEYDGNIMRHNLTSTCSVTHNVQGNLNYNTDNEFNVSATGNISLLTNSEDYTHEMTIGHSSSPYYIGRYGIYKDTPASRLNIDGTYGNAETILNADYHGLNIVNSVSSSTLMDYNYANIIIDKSSEKIRLHSDEIIVGKKSDITSTGNVPGIISNVATPTADDHAANKAYVDAAKDHILLKDTATNQTYKLSITNGKLGMEVVE